MKDNHVNLVVVVVGQEAPLVAGLTDEHQIKRRIPVFGPSKTAASSTPKDLMKIQHPNCLLVYSQREEARKHSSLQQGLPSLFMDVLGKRCCSKLSSKTNAKAVKICSMMATIWRRPVAPLSKEFMEGERQRVYHTPL